MTGEAMAVITRRRMSRRRRANLRNGLLFVSPMFVGLLAFTIYPLLASFYYSLTDYTILQPPSFVGLDNYTLLFNDAEFTTSIGNTLWMVVVALPIGLVFNFLVALLLNMRLKGLAFFRTVFYLPTIVPAVATGILWLWILNPQYGLANTLLRVVGIDGPGWLSDPAWAKPSFVLIGLWTGGNAILIYLAGLQDVPPELYEAAELDGAGAVSRTRHVTLPMVTPVIFFNLVTGLIAYFQYFTQAYVITVQRDGGVGGPADSTLFYSLYLYQNAFNYFKMGYASAQAWILFLITLVCTVIVFGSSSRWVFYRGR
jgi:multiple sugar transport system permease protein